MMLTIEVKSVFGNDLMYPACEKSNLLAKLAGKKTFGPHDIIILGKLGYTFEVKPQELKELV